MAGVVATPVAAGSVAGVGGNPPGRSGGQLYVPDGGFVGVEGSSSSEESGSEEGTGSEESDSDKGQEEQEGEFDHEDYYEDQGWWDEDGTYHWKEGEEYQLLGEYGYGEGDEDRMLWTCGICNVAVNIFARDDHIASRPHIRAAKDQAGESSESMSERLAYVPMWRCTVCEEDMSVFLREDHIFAKEHLRKLRNLRAEEGVDLGAQDETHTPERPQQDNDGHPYVSDETILSSMNFPDMPQPRFASSEYKWRKTFYCAICSGEFDLATEELHLDEVETWDCTRCLKTMHPAAKELHLESERHKIMTSIPENQPDFYCEVCRRYYSPIDKEKHLAGTDHQQAVARIEFEEQCRKRIEMIKNKPTGPPQASPFAPLTGKGKEVQSGQDTKRGHTNWVCEMCNQPIIGISVQAHLTTGCPATRHSRAMRGNKVQTGNGGQAANEQKACNLCHEPLMGLSVANHLKMICPGVSRPTPVSGGVVPTGQDSRRENDIWSCNLCKEPLLGLSLEGHLKSFCPLFKTSTTPNVPKNANKYFCTVCGKGGKIPDEKAHYGSKKHQRKVQNAQGKAKAKAAAAAGQPVRPKPRNDAPKEYCGICNKYKHAQPMQDHLKSKKHLKKLAAHQQAAGRTTTEAQPQSETAAPPKPQPTALSGSTLRFVPPQVMGQPIPPALPQLGPQVPSPTAQKPIRRIAPQLISPLAPRAVPRVSIPAAVPHPIPQTATAAPVSSLNSPHISVSGNKFRCSLCARNRYLVGLENHVASKLHKRKLRALGQ